LRLLTDFLVDRIARRLGREFTGVSVGMMERLQAYSWPGNVRELQNVIERAAVLSPGRVLDLEPGFVLPEAAGAATAGRPSGPAAQAPPAPGTRDGSPASTLVDVERRHILEVLSSTRGVIEGPQGAARVLQLHPNTLRSRMKRLGIRRAPHEIS
jgi:formate hydrogenlyase transcriptional activator